MGLTTVATRSYASSGAVAHIMGRCPDIPPAFAVMIERHHEHIMTLWTDQDEDFLERWVTDDGSLMVIEYIKSVAPYLNMRVIEQVVTAIEEYTNNL